VKPVFERNALEVLTAGSKALGVEVDQDEALLLLEFLDRFYDWNRFCGFTRIAREDGLRLHLLDSLSVIHDLVGAVTIVDLGTGGGMPGMPLAIASREAKFTLVEARGRRCNFLREIVRDFELEGRVEIVEGDARELVGESRRFDAVVARAFLPPMDLLNLGSRLITELGRVLVMGSNEEWLRQADLARLNRQTGLALRYQRSLTLPSGGEPRRIFRFEPGKAECFT
jgi:16S rRNA (guanine527-N7)-methyltransferase